MGFFGLKLAFGEEARVEVPEGWTLRLASATLCNHDTPPTSRTKADATGDLTLWVHAEAEEDAEGDAWFAACSATASARTSRLDLVFTGVDNPVQLKVSGRGESKLHVTGYFEPDPYQIGDSDESEGEEEDGVEEASGDGGRETEKSSGLRGEGVVASQRGREMPSEGARSKTAPAAAAAAQAAAAAANEEQRRLRKAENRQKAEAQKRLLAQAFADQADDGETKGNGTAAVEAPSKKQKRAKEAGAGSGSGGAAGAASGGSKAPVVLARPSERQLAGGLRVKDLVVGGGAVAASGKQVAVLYEGSFPGGKVFDSNWNRRKPLKFRVGLGQVVPGMDRGVEGMRVGGKRELFIPAPLAYGKCGTGPIPPNQPLVFSVELVSVGGAGKK